MGGRRLRQWLWRHVENLSALIFGVFLNFSVPFVGFSFIRGQELRSDVYLVYGRALGMVKVVFYCLRFGVGTG